MPFKEEVKIALSNRKIDKLNEWRSRYSKHEYPYKVVLNMFYELYSISFIWDEISSYFSGNKRYSDFKQAYHYVADLKSEVQVQKVNPQLIQLLNSNVKAGPESFSVWEEDIEKAKNGDNTAVEQIEYGYFWYAMVCDVIVAWAACGLIGNNKREAFIDSTGSEFGDMTYNEDLEETIKWIGAGMSFTIKRFYKKLPDFWDSNK